MERVIGRSGVRAFRCSGIECRGEASPMTVTQMSNESACINGLKSFATGLRLIDRRNSGQNIFDDVAVDVGKAFVAALVEVGQLTMVEAHQVQDGGVDV